MYPTVGALRFEGVNVTPQLCSCTAAPTLSISQSCVQMRFSLRELAAASAPTLSTELRARLASQHAALAAAVVPDALQPARARLERSWLAASAAAEDTAALMEIEEGSQAAVEALRKLPEATRSGPPSQRLLRSSFSSLIGNRALVQALAAGAPLMPTAELSSLLQHVIDDSRAFCREKFGDSPEIRVAEIRVAGGEDSSTPADSVMLAPFVAFPVHEILKNAMGAHVRRVGADKLDQLAPIEVRHGVRAGVAFVGVSDYGGGLTEPSHALRFLQTTNKEREATYTYSRAFGSAFEGLGVGLPLAALHARYLNGKLFLNAVPNGVHAAFTFDVTGNSREPEDETPTD